MIEPWHDGRLGPGADWRQEIHDRLEEADIIVLLVTKDFLNSDYCYSTEMDRAMQRHRAGQAIVIPVLVRACDWQIAPFAELQALPAKGQAIMSWADPDEAYAQVAIGIRESVQRVRDKRKA